MVDKMGGICDTAKVFVVLVSLLLLALPVQANPVEDVAPLPPWALIADEDDAGIQLAWNAPVGPVDGYNVYRAESMEAVALQGLEAFSLVGQTSDTAFLDSLVGGAPVYVVTASYDTRESAPSNLAGYPYCLALRPGCFLPPPFP